MRYVITAAVVVSLAFSALAAAAPFRGESTGAKPTITSIAFENQGAGATPVVIVAGSGPGKRPSHDPAYRPSPPNANVPPFGCTTTGNVG